MDESSKILKMEDKSQKIPYPKRVFLIVGSEFCERFNHYGMKSVLSLYLKNKLGCSENDAMVWFHAFSMASNLMCIFGGILSDVWLGKFKTILYLSIVYSIGSAIVSLSSIKLHEIPPDILLIIGLVLTAVGSGGIKPCVSAFGGDQFILPHQASQLFRFFSLFYFSVNAGSLLSTTITPILRADVHCLGNEDCFPLAFGVPSLLMMLAVGLFLIGKPFYTYVAISSENMLIQVIKCISNAISMKFRDSHNNTRKNLLDYSINKYGEELVEDTRCILRILILYLPLPLYWSLYEQKRSRWTFQANRMHGNLGFYTIKPDQMQVMNPLLLFILIPTFEAIIYPLLFKIGIRRPLQKMVIGGTFAAIAFLLSALVQFRIQASPPNSMNMLWLLRQYTAISIAEIMLSINGMTFSYEQAPKCMKSVVMASWLLSISLGNLILMLIAKSAVFQSQAHEFSLFSGLMFADVLIFGFLAHRYKNENQNKGSEIEKTDSIQGIP